LWGLALGHGVCCCSKFFQRKKCGQPFVHPFKKIRKERVQNLTSQFFIPRMILLGFIELIIEVAIDPFHPYLTCGYYSYIILEVEISTLLWFGLMDVKNSLVIV
jgi:hypothetical protein